MSATDYRLKCPHGHTDIYRRNPGHPFSHGRDEPYWCRTCRLLDSDAHYTEQEVTRETPNGRNVDLGYVWSPSHDE
jgi:hypothetical protein